MTHRLFVQIKGSTEGEVVSVNVAYGAAQGLGMIADALGAAGVTCSIYPEPESAEANFIMPRLVPAAALVFYAAQAIAEERGDEALEQRIVQAQHDLKTLAQQGRQREAKS